MRLSIIVALASLPLAGTAAAQTGASPAPSITLYELPAYLGRSVTITSETPDLATAQFSARAQSARVVGQWTVCPQAKFQGSCTTLSADTPVLRRATAVSLRPVVAAGSTTPAAGTSANDAVDLDSLDADAGTEGQDVAFFARPSLGGTQVSAGNNDRASGDAFCKRAGFSASAYSGRARTQASNLIDLGTANRVRAFPLRDVLCRK